MRSLRGRLTLGVVAVLAVVLAATGVLASRYSDRTARDALDDRLVRTADLYRATADKAISESIPRPSPSLDNFLTGQRSSLRLIVGSAPVFEAGRRLLEGPPPRPGLRTVEQGDERFRVLVRPIPNSGFKGAVVRLEVASSLRELEDRQAGLDRRLVLLSLIALLLGGLASYFATARILGPLRRLRLAARRVTADDDLTVRVSESDGPAEVRELGASINAMLAQIETASESRERALAATRRFALDAGHELRTPLTTVQATLSSLHRHADIPPAQREEMLCDALAEQRRLVTLLDGLQAYARGDASAVAHEPVDLADVVASSANEHRVHADLPDAPVVIDGWEPGLRLLTGNLIANAVRHGGGEVRVTLEAGPPPVLIVDDGGPGIPEADRERVFEPFERLGAAGEGSGLGLALVAQQAREHGATLTITESPLGGTRVTCRYPIPT